MTKREKLIARFLAEPPEVDFEDVCQLLEMFGYELRKTRGTSHRVFVAPGRETITVPLVSGRKVKRTYIQAINRKLDLNSYVSYVEGEE